MKTKLVILFTVVLGFVSCKNQDIEFDDFGKIAVYFPNQTPIRTLIRGEYPHGINDNDNANRFEVGIVMSGVYENAKDRKVYYKVDPTLLDGVVNVEALPTSYYTIEGLDSNGEGMVTIPSGSIDGRIKVQLTDQFLDDPKSFAESKSVNYVLPLLITKQEGCDTILSGLPYVNDGNASRTNVIDWDIAPKDYTLFGIKYINEYDGVYIIHGADKAIDDKGVSFVSNYHANDIRNDRQVKVMTTGRSSVEYSNLIYREDGSPGNVNIELTFDETGDCIVDGLNGNYTITGSGQFVKKGAFSELSEDKVDVMYVNYSYKNDVYIDNPAYDKDNPTLEPKTIFSYTETHDVKDTLYILDRNVVFEQFEIELNN